jgi:hypothetical protein
MNEWLNEWINECRGLVEWYWVGQAKHSKSNISKCHFIQHRSHTGWAGIELGHLGWEYNRVLNEPHTIRIIAEKTEHSICFCLVSQHCRQPPAPHCLRQNVSRCCDTATSCNCQQMLWYCHMLQLSAVQKVAAVRSEQYYVKHTSKNHRCYASEPSVGLVRNFPRNKMRDGLHTWRGENTYRSMRSGTSWHSLGS